MPLVSKRRSLACRAERLARTGAGPNRSIVWPSGFAQGVRPDANAGEKMALRESCKVAWQDILDISFVNNSVGNMPCLYEFAQPCSGVLVDFVVIRCHDASSPLRCNALNPSAYVYSWREKSTPITRLSDAMYKSVSSLGKPLSASRCASGSGNGSARNSIVGPVGIGRTRRGCIDRSIMRPFSSRSSRSSRPSQSVSARSSRPP